MRIFRPENCAFPTCIIYFQLVLCITNLYFCYFNPKNCLFESQIVYFHSVFEKTHIENCIFPTGIIHFEFELGISNWNCVCDYIWNTSIYHFFFCISKNELFDKLQKYFRSLKSTTFCTISQKTHSSRKISFEVD